MTDLERRQKEHEKTKKRIIAGVDTLCWICQNALPDKKNGRGCEWSRKLKPVPGWTADKEKVNVGFKTHHEQVGIGFEPTQEMIDAGGSYTSNKTTGELEYIWNERMLADSYLVRKCPLFKETEV